MRELDADLDHFLLAHDKRVVAPDGFGPSFPGSGGYILPVNIYQPELPVRIEEEQGCCHFARISESRESRDGSTHFPNRRIDAALWLLRGRLGGRSERVRMGKC